MSNKIAIYTAITNNYEGLKKPKYHSKDIDYIAFSDKKIKSDFWHVIVLDETYSALDSIRKARKIKILGHQALKSYEYTVWIDGNINVIGDVKELINYYADSDLVTFKHPQRTCVYDEANACIEYMKDSRETIIKQVALMREHNYPEENGLVESNVLIRKKTDAINSSMTAWWEMVLNYSRRDQLSFNYTASIHKLNYALMGKDNARGSSKYFSVRRDHETARKLKFHFFNILSKLKLK